MANEMMTATEMKALLTDFIVKAKITINESICKKGESHVVTLLDGSMTVKMENGKYRLAFISPDLKSAIRLNSMEANRVAMHWNNHVEKASLRVRVVTWKAALETHIAVCEEMISHISE